MITFIRNPSTGIFEPVLEENSSCTLVSAPFSRRRFLVATSATTLVALAPNASYAIPAWLTASGLIEAIGQFIVALFEAVVAEPILAALRKGKVGGEKPVGSTEDERFHIGYSDTYGLVNAKERDSYGRGFQLNGTRLSPVQGTQPSADDVNAVEASALTGMARRTGAAVLHPSGARESFVRLSANDRQEQRTAFLRAINEQSDLVAAQLKYVRDFVSPTGDLAARGQAYVASRRDGKQEVGMLLHQA